MGAQGIGSVTVWCGVCLIQSAMADGSAQADGAGPLEPAADDAWPSFEVAVEYCTRQLTYGLVDNRDPIVAAEAAAECHGFTFESTVIFDTTDWGARHGGYGDRTGSYQELAFGPGCAHAFTPEGCRVLPTTVELFANYRYEHHPPVNRARGEANPDTQVVGAGAALPDLALAPTFAAELDIDDEAGAAYFSGGVGHAFTLVKASGGRETDPPSLVLGAGIGLGSPERNACDAGYRHWAFKDVWASAALEWQVADHVSVGPYAAVYEQLASGLREAARHGEDGASHASVQLVCGVRVAAHF